MFADSRQRSTWVGLQLMVPLQGEDQGAGSRAKYLSRSKVHAIIYLEVKAARQCTCTRTEWKKIIKQMGLLVTRSFLPGKNGEKPSSPLCTNNSCPVWM